MSRYRVQSTLLADEATRFETALGSRFEATTLIPLWGINPDGSCACAKPNCRNAGKHAAIKWADVTPGSKMLTRPDGVGVGVALLTGSTSGWIVVIDVDTKGVDGFATLDALETLLGRLPRTLQVDTPTGGMHIYVRVPGVRISNQAGRLGPGLDIRGERGYVAIPGSPHKAGGHYTVSCDAPIADLPQAWIDHLPKYQERPVVVGNPDHEIVDVATLRQRLVDTAKGRRGDEWVAWRAAAKGERMFRIQGSPESDAPLVLGVDEFMSKSMIWSLANTGEWRHVAPDDMAALVAPSLAVLRADVEALGATSAWYPDHFAEKWARAASKVDGMDSRIADGLERIVQAAAEAHATALPPILQIGTRYLVLDDRKDPKYEHCAAERALPLKCERLWPGDSRPLWRETKAGRERMTGPELAHMYGRDIHGIVTDYTASRPFLEDGLLIQSSPRAVLPDPVRDAQVQIWIERFGGDAVEPLLDWIVYAQACWAHTTVPALALIGGSHVGKTLLAMGLAVAAGQRIPVSLGKALGRFNSDLQRGHIVFADEGIPRGERGQPLTEEFRALITATEHHCELKGVDTGVTVRGGVRAILAANARERLFTSKGNLNAEDVAALMRRLLVITVDGRERIAATKDAALALGASEGDPVRLARVAGHLRWIQTTRTPRAPEPVSSGLQTDLRRDGAGSALDVLEDFAANAADWIVPSEDGALLWVRPKDWAQFSSVNHGQLGRIVRPYIVKPSHQRKTHPVTGVPDLRRWAALDLHMLRADGVQLDWTQDAG